MRHGIRNGGRRSAGGRHVAGPNDRLRYKVRMARDQATVGAGSRSRIGRGRAAMLVGYMRVSKTDGTQPLDLQRDALLRAGVGADATYEDQASGKLAERPGLAACLKALRKGDVLVVWKLDRLGRS